MAAPSPAEVSEKRSNFRIRQLIYAFFNIAANLTLNTMASFVIIRLTLGAHAHIEGYKLIVVVVCVCVCVCMCVCVCVCVCV